MKVDEDGWERHGTIGLLHQISVMTCPECGALVEESNRKNHEKWHETTDPLEGP